jgi:DNA-binding NarL/FixJ family response regulator
MKITLGLVDDHKLFIDALRVLVDSFSGMNVIVVAYSGQSLLDQMATFSVPPDIVLVDVEIPEMNGIQVVKQVTERYPLVRLVALSMKGDDLSIIRMLNAGCCAYLLKEIHAAELERALSEIGKTGYYNSDSSNTRYRRLAMHARDQPGIQLSEREKTFVELACSDLTYKQIASKMNLSERTIDGYRESLFEKFKVQSRVGMALEAIRLKFYKIKP